MSESLHESRGMIFEPRFYRLGLVTLHNQFLYARRKPNFSTLAPQPVSRQMLGLLSRANSRPDIFPDVYIDGISVWHMNEGSCRQAARFSLEADRLSANEPDEETFIRRNLSGYRQYREALELSKEIDDFGKALRSAYPLSLDEPCPVAIGFELAAVPLPRVLNIAA